MALTQDEVTTIVRSVVDYGMTTLFIAAKSGNFMLMVEREMSSCPEVKS